MIIWAQLPVLEIRTRLTSTSCADGVPLAKARREAPYGVPNARRFCACWGGEPCCAPAGAPIQKMAVRRMRRQSYLGVIVVLPSFSAMEGAEACRGMPRLN